MTRLATLPLLAALALAACGRGADERSTELAAAARPAAGQIYTVTDTVLPSVIEAAGLAEPVRRAVLSTKLMGSVVSVRVREGERVHAGQVLAQVDARDIAAKRTQARARVAEAEALRADAATQAERFRALYRDEAATKVQLEAAETGLARAEAALNAARGAESELEAVGAYAEVRAPFAGIVASRAVDPGAFVAPGQPILTVEDGSTLRIAATVAPRTARGLHPGDRLQATIEGAPADAVVEGAVPSAGALYTVNALVENGGGKFLAGSAATLSIAEGSRRAVLVPDAALVREGDLTGVRVATPAAVELRWIRTGARLGPMVEVQSGLRPGDRVVLPAPEETP
jgi:RND family efflux transporter MFP subunit